MTHKPTGKGSSLNVASKPIYAVLPAPNQNSGPNGLLGQNFGLTLPFKVQLA